MAAQCSESFAPREVSLDDRVEIRAATVADAALVTQFIHELAEYERLADSCYATEESVRRTLFSDDPAANVLIATVGGEPAGFALYFRNYSTHLSRPGIYLEDLFVRPVMRRQGVGEALIRAVARCAAERDYGRVEWSVLKWNTLAIDFYRKIGAQPLDEWLMFRLSGKSLERVAGG